MGRTNLVILLFGLAACIAMSLMMQRLLKMSEKEKASPVKRELSAMFASRLDGPIGYEIVKDGETRIGRVEARLAPGSTRTERLARAMGQHVWRREGVRKSLDTVEVVLVDSVDGRRNTQRVNAPLDVRRQLGDLPAPPPTRTTQPVAPPPAPTGGGAVAGPPPKTAVPPSTPPATPPPGSEEATPPAPPGGKR